MNCTGKAVNERHCNCTYPGCPRHGVCCECITYHMKKDQLPACYFSKEQEATWNRSIDYFISERNGKK
ncbi:MAG: hypothetical protein JXR95_11590 [Deltaproteobacteria bacterium]|nr:hypothetical protein [Deltaproteobacteria bacterium]